MDPWCEDVRKEGTGFHTLIGEPDPLRSVRWRCECVLDNLERLLQNTQGPTPPRDRDFCLSREYPGKEPLAEEATWERAMWRRWGPPGNGAPFLPICPRLQTYQYPIKRVRDDAGWGRIDLLGVSPDYRPVVVELKRGESNDTVLRMLLEMVAYGIALRNVWPELRAPHWETAIREAWQHEAPPPEDLGRVTLIGVAPPRYWARAQGADPTDPTGHVPEDAWRPFCELVAEVSRRCDFSIHFARVDEGPSGAGDVGILNDGDPPPPFEGHPQPVRADVIPLCPGR